MFRIKKTPSWFIGQTWAILICDCVLRLELGNYAKYHQEATDYASRMLCFLNLFLARIIILSAHKFFNTLYMFSINPKLCKRFYFCFQRFCSLVGKS